MFRQAWWGGLVVTLALVGCAAAQEAPANGPSWQIWNCDQLPAGADAAGLELVAEPRHEGAAAVRWRNHPQQSRLGMGPLPRDWTGYHRLEFWLHMARAVPTSMMVIIGSENSATEGPDYYGTKVSLNFAGWKLIRVQVGTGSGSREPLGWHAIDGVSFVTSGWGLTPHPEVDLVLDDVRLVYDPPRPGPLTSDAEFFAALDLDRPGLEAVKAAVGAGDLAAAKDALLTYWRERETPRWYRNWRDRPNVDGPLTGGSDGWDYYGTSFRVDFTGWREVVLPLARFGVSRQPLGWDQINSLQFSATYGDRTPSPGTVLTFDQVRLTGGGGELLLADFEADDAFAPWTGLSPTTEQVQAGARAAAWLDARRGVNLRELPRDWTPYQELRLWVYAPAATGDVITVIAESDTPNTSAADRVVAHYKGDTFLGEDIDWEINCLPPTDPAFTKEWTYNLNRFGQWETLGQAYWATGNEVYAAEWVAQMRDWVEDNPLPLYSTGNETLTWRTIEAGIRTAGSWQNSLAFFLGYPKLTGDDLVTFLKSWLEHGFHLMRITLEHPDHGGNWVTMECNGLGHLGILFPEAKDSALWYQTAVDRMLLEIDDQVYPDGAQMELTPGYHQVSRLNFVQLYKLAQFNQVPIPAAYLAGLERMYDYNLRVMMPSGHLPPLNDSGLTAVREPLAEGAALFGRADFRWAATVGSSGTRPGYTSTALDHAGWYIMRSGWDLADRYLLFEAGPYGTGHQHEDKLTLFLYADGRPLLTEAGNYSYDNSKYRRYVLGTWAHNTILVDGQGQRRNGLTATYRTREPLDNLWLTNEVFDAADGVYDHGYGPRREIQARHERTVMFMRPDYYIVLDRLPAAGPHRYDVLFNLDNDLAASDPATLAGWGADPEVANLLVTPAATPGLGLDIVTGRHDEPVLGFAPAARKKPIPVLNYHLTGAGPTELAWVLTPFRGERPAVRATVETRPEGSLITVDGPTGRDQVMIAKRGGRASHAGLTGRVIAARYDKDGQTVTRRAE